VIRNLPLGAGFAVAVIAAAVAAGIIPVVLLGLDQGFLRGGLIDSYFLRILWFTMLQAGLSMLISVGLAIPVARALSRSDFPGRSLLLRLFALPLALPAIVVILGIVAAYGRTGWLSTIIGRPADIYGLTGILLAHVFFNLPLATRLLLQQLDGIPPENWRLAAELRFNARDRFRLIEWPALKGALPGVASLVFLLCAASFAVVLTLGGGPQATTLEVAIYQSLRLDYDPARATVLALAQLLLCGVFVLLAGSSATAMQSWPQLRTAGRRYDSVNAPADMIVILLAGLFVIIPMAALVVAGVTASVNLPAIASAALTSVSIAAAAMIVSLALAWPLANAMARSQGRFARGLFGLAALLALILPPAVLATGWFIIAIRLGLPLSGAALLVVAMNSLMALPFTLGTLAPAVANAAAQHDRLCASLNIAGFARLRLIDIPALRRPLGLAAAMGFVVSLGDLTAIMLFGSQELITLPALIQAQMGSYRIDEAGATALALALMSLAVIVLIERWSAEQ
jgi:thiamine transport system permease protein